jgi:hypothetical protein
MPNIPSDPPGGKPPKPPPPPLSAGELLKRRDLLLKGGAERPKITSAPKPPPGPLRRGRIHPPEAPAPPTELNTSHSSPPALPLGAPELNLYVTAYFPDELKSAIAKARIAADRRFRREVRKANAAGSVNDQKLVALNRQWFWAVFLGFATGAHDIVRAGIREAAYFVDCWPVFYREAASAAGIKWDRPEVDAELKDSREWKKFESILRKAIDAPVKRKQPVGKRKLAGSGVSKPVRRGWKPEIDQWRKPLGLTIPQAADKLGVGESTLKNIMTSRGKRRYCAETLTNVLNAAGIKP